MTTTASRSRCDAFVGGRSQPAERTFVDLDPATGDVLADVARCGPAEVNEAVAAARDAFETVWGRRAPADRAEVLARIAALIRRDAEELERLESLDTGKPLTQARADVQVAARYFDYYAHVCEAVFGEHDPARRPPLRLHGPGAARRDRAHRAVELPSADVRVAPSHRRSRPATAA